MSLPPSERKKMTHPTTQAMAEIKRALALASRTAATLTDANSAPVDHGPAWVALEGGQYMDGPLYRRVKIEVLARIPDLPPAGIFPLRKICSPEFWASLDNVDKRQAGRCLMHLVRNKEVNLVLVSLAGVSPQLYCKP
jgi:hypothetical protein